MTGFSLVILPFHVIKLCFPRYVMTALQERRVVHNLKVAAGRSIRPYADCISAVTSLPSLRTWVRLGGCTGSPRGARGHRGRTSLRRGGGRWVRHRPVRSANPQGKAAAVLLRVVLGRRRPANEVRESRGIRLGESAQSGADTGGHGIPVGERCDRNVLPARTRRGEPRAGRVTVDLRWKLVFPAGGGLDSAAELVLRPRQR